MPMFNILDKINDDIVKKALTFEKVQTDNFVFRLFYKFTVWLVAFYSIFHLYVTMNAAQISCTGTINNGLSGGKYIKYVEDFCWVHGTFTVRETDGASKRGQIYPGVKGVTRHDSTVYHHYYKWMYLVIFFMMIALFTPRWLWRLIEGGKLKSIGSKMSEILIIDNDDAKKEMGKLTDYLFHHLGYHSRYAFGFIMCEVLNVGVSSFMMYIWDLLSGHELSKHASLSIYRTPFAMREDPLREVFPIIGKCTVSIYGPSGNIEPHDFICVLPINAVNEYAAVFFWFYFMTLTAVGLASLVFRMVIVLSKRVRVHLLSKHLPFSTKEEIVFIVEHCSYSDWFVFHGLAVNMEPVVFRQILESVISRMQGKEDVLVQVEEPAPQRELMAIEV